MNHILSIDSEQLWEETKDLFEVEPTAVALDNLNTTHFGRLSILTHNVSFEACFVKKNTKKLIVFVSGPGRRNYSSPAFWRKSYSSYFDDSCLYIDDPCNIEKKFAPTFFWGNNDLSYMDCVLEIVSKIKEIYRIENKDILFTGCSNTGFVAIYCSSKMDFSSCIALSPQINMRLYLQDNNLLKKFNNLFSYDFLSDKFINRIDITNIFLNNKKSKYFLSSNITCSFDQSQMKYLFSKFNIPYKIGLNAIENKYIYITNFNVNHPHLFHPEEGFFRSIYNFLRKPSPDVESAYSFNSQCKSLFWYFKEKDSNEELNKKNYSFKKHKNSLISIIQKNNTIIKKLKTALSNSEIDAKKLSSENEEMSKIMQNLQLEIIDKNKFLNSLEYKLADVEESNNCITKKNESLTYKNEEFRNAISNILLSDEYNITKKVFKTLEKIKYFKTLFAPFIFLYFYIILKE